MNKSYYNAGGVGLLSTQDRTIRWLSPGRALFVALFLLSSCGSRSGLDERPIEDGALCRTAADCSDGLFCNGAERCLLGRCAPGLAPSCDDGYECSIDACSEDDDRCVHLEGVPDLDGDGAGRAVCGGDDCDDDDPLVYPGAPERCDGRDDDCDGVVDWLGAPVAITALLSSEGSFAHDLIRTDSGWLVAWHHSGGEVESLELVALSPTGEVVRRLVPDDAPADELITPSLIRLDRFYGLVWNAYDLSSDSSTIRFDLLDEDLALQTSLGVLSDAENELSSPRAAARESGDLAVVHRVGGFGAPLSQLAFQQILGSEGGWDVSESRALTDVDDDAFAPSLRWIGSAYGLAYLTERDGEFSVMFLRLSPEGEVLGWPMRLVSTPWFPFSVTLAMVGGELLIAWSVLQFVSAGEMRFARLTADGAPIEVDEPLTEQYASSVRPALAWGGGATLGLAWAHYPDGEILPSARAEIRFAMISPEGRLLSTPLLLSRDILRATHPELLWAGDHFVLVFTGEDDGREQLYFSRVCP